MRIVKRILLLILLGIVGWGSLWAAKNSDYTRKEMRDSVLVSAWSYEYRTKHNTEEKFKGRFRDTNTGIYYETQISGYLFTQYNETKQHIGTRFPVSDRDLYFDKWKVFTHEIFFILIFAVCLTAGLMSVLCWMLGFSIWTGEFDD